MAVVTVKPRVGGMFHVLGSSTVAAEEAETLVPLIAAKANAVGPAEQAFVESSLEKNLALYIRRAPALKKWYRVLGLVTFASGLASTALAAFSKSDPTRVTIAILGVLVGLLTHLLQFWRPAERSGAYYRARSALLREGWTYLMDAGVYEHLADERARFLRFQAQVCEIEKAAAAIDEQSEPAATAAAPAAAAAGDKTDKGDKGDKTDEGDAEGKDGH